MITLTAHFVCSTYSKPNDVPDDVILDVTLSVCQCLKIPGMHEKAGANS